MGIYLDRILRARAGDAKRHQPVVRKEPAAAALRKEPAAMALQMEK